MPKFVVKNKRKRKYIRKSETPTYLFSKTGASSLPLFILAIAFVTTVVMNLHIKEPFITLPDLNLRFTFSFDEVLQPFKTLPNIFTQPIAFLTASLGLFWQSVQTLVMQTIQGIFYLISFFDPRPAVEQTNNFSTQTITQGIQTSNVIFKSLYMMLTNGMYALVVLILYLSMLLREAIYTVAYTLGIGSYNVISIVGGVIWNVFTVILHFAGAILNGIYNGIVSIVRIPFDAAASLGVMLKPYTDILGTHVQMVGDDMQSSVDSLNNVSRVLQSH